MPITRPAVSVLALFGLALVAAIVSATDVRAAQMAESTVVTESMGPAATPAGECGCRGVQQPPWHGTVRDGQCGVQQPHCRGSNVYQAHPFQQLHSRPTGCVTLPPCLPRLHALCREGYLPSPIPPRQPRCHECGAAIEGGF